LNETYVYLQNLKREGAIQENMEGNILMYKAI